MDFDLVCNFRKCRKRLTTHAWVTSCSHAFCDEDGAREFRQSQTCPACDTNLTGKMNIIRADLQPSEQHKSMLLAGLRPETIMEIATRALSFWTYQAHQELTYQEYVSTKAKEKTRQVEQYYERAALQLQTELNNTDSKNQTANTTKEIEDLKKRLSEVTEKMQEKARQYQRLQTMYDSLRRKSITPANFGDGGRPTTPRTSTSSSCFDMNTITTIDEVMRRRMPDHPELQRYVPPERDHHIRTPVVTSASDLNIFSDMHVLTTPRGTRRPSHPAQ